MGALMGARMRFRWLSGLAAMLLLAALPAAGQPRIQVLLLFDEDDDLPGLALTNRNLRETLTAEFGEDISFYCESLQLSQFSEPEYDAIQADYLHRKYQGKRLDLVVAVMEPSLDFLLRHRERLAGTAPIVFCGVDSYDIESKILPADVTGVLMKRQFGPTLATALELQPNLRQVYVVGGTSRFDRKLQDMARRDFAAFADRVSIHWLTDLSMQALLDQVATLPPDSALYYLTLFTDGQGQAFATHDSLRRLARAANAPRRRTPKRRQAGWSRSSSSRFSATVISPTTPWRLRSSGIRPTPARTTASGPPMGHGTPKSRISPALGSTRPERSAASTVWPFPETPAMPKISWA